MHCLELYMKVLHSQIHLNHCLMESSTFFCCQFQILCHHPYGQ
nr:MAG TPA: hypothetical protein [Caudoviricetes sp.]